MSTWLCLPPIKFLRKYLFCATSSASLGRHLCSNGDTALWRMLTRPWPAPGTCVGHALINDGRALCHQALAANSQLPNLRHTGFPDLAKQPRLPPKTSSLDAGLDRDGCCQSNFPSWFPEARSDQVVVIVRASQLASGRNPLHKYSSRTKTRLLLEHAGSMLAVVNATCEGAENA